MLVGEGRVALFDAGATPNWAQAQHRTLQRVAAPAAADVQRTLSAHAWTLTRATDARGQELASLRPNAARPVVLAFADGRMSVEGGCNRTFGGYRIDADGRLVAARMASTLMACEADLMKVDATLADLLAEPMTIDLSSGAPPTLRLVAPRRCDARLRRTHDARGPLRGPGARVLEVAAQTVARPNPPPGASRCLQVRELQFDHQGLRGARPALATVRRRHRGLYAQRTACATCSASSASTAAGDGHAGVLYVLDLVVESEVVQR